MSIRYSVIIPAYNAEKTIRRCLDSLVSIIRDDVELLVINDGSGDRTGEICQEYAERYSNVRYFYKENGGVSSARNMGLDEAAGEYILFVDSDDFVTEEYFRIFDTSLKRNPDFAVSGRYIFDGREMIPQAPGNCAVYTSDETAVILSKALRQQLLNSPVSKAFRRSLIEKDKIRFDSRLPIGEDKVFVIQYIMGISSLVINSKSIYVISTENEESLSRKKRENLCDYILLEHKLLFQAVKESSLEKRNKKRYMKALYFSYYRSAYTVIAEIYKFTYSRNERLKKIRRICKKYNAQMKKIAPDIKVVLAAFPVYTKAALLIDIILCRNLGKKL